ncbi:hypothetical protein VTK73DRAFT_4861 [Phialemonium thermophilum]|uniref:SLC26A/SulP transporter domain-containing protein n=1 Tax=Phialemonium thermophilum TaxID=223376 RepID=A0ABR3V5E6_9PEZI
MSLPAFGGYGRSKVNKATGGVSPMSSVFLSLLTLVCILFLLPYFYYLPVGSSPPPLLLLLRLPLPVLPLDRSWLLISSILAPPETRPLVHDQRRRLVPDRGVPRRHRLLRPHPRLARAGPHARHRARHHLLLADPGHRHRRRPVAAAGRPPRHPAPHPDPGPHPRHPALRERRGRPGPARVRRGLPHRQDPRAPDLCQHRRAQDPPAPPRAVRHLPGPPGPAAPAPRGGQPQRRLRHPRRHLARRLGRPGARRDRPGLPAARRPRLLQPRAAEGASRVGAHGARGHRRGRGRGEPLRRRRGGGAEADGDGGGRGAERADGGHEPLPVSGACMENGSRPSAGSSFCIGNSLFFLGCLAYVF